MSALPGVRAAGISSGATASTDGSRDTWVNATLRRDDARIDDPALARQVAALVDREYPPSRDADVLTVELRYGYDIGIASGWRKYRYNFTKAQRAALHPE